MWEHKNLLEWKKLRGQDFERLVATILREKGFKILKGHGGAGDWGVDIVAEKEGRRIYIQCKQKEVVKPSEIREFWGSIVDRIKSGDLGIFITTGRFTQEGLEFSEGKPIRLITGIELEKFFKGQVNL